MALQRKSSPQAAGEASAEALGQVCGIVRMTVSEQRTVGDETRVSENFIRTLDSSLSVMVSYLTLSRTQI